jgi:hypothetical protein
MRPWSNRTSSIAARKWAAQASQVLRDRAGAFQRAARRHAYTITLDAIHAQQAGVKATAMIRASMAR